VGRSVRREIEAMAAVTREAALVRALGDSTVARLHAARVLVVGAGGIGCELLKNLVMTGFRDVVVIDLDTIDVSNLNRQFLFRPQHVGQPKALVAAAAVRAMNPAATVVAHHANIKEDRFGVAFFRGFTLVINALDNVPARRHVNRLCLSAAVPLIEAGTEGYRGQSYVIAKGITECFDCEPKAGGKTYPLCTIRSTPDRPVHCVVWAQELYKLLFGDAKTSYLFEDDGALTAGAGAGAGAGSAAAAPARAESVYMQVVREAGGGAREESAFREWARRLFNALFRDEIIKRLSMMAETGTAAVGRSPVPLDIDDIEAGRVGGPAVDATSGGGAGAGAGLRDQRVLTLAESAALWLSALERYFKPGVRPRGEADEATVASVAAAVDAYAVEGLHRFEKDSELDLDFVTAATNLRALTYGIPMQSRFDVKSIAGNIIPAIATTNAIVAGLEVLEAVKIVRGDDIAASCKCGVPPRGVAVRAERRGCRTPLCSPACVRARVRSCADTRTSSARPPTSASC